MKHTKSAILGLALLALLTVPALSASAQGTDLQKAATANSQVTDVKASNFQIVPCTNQVDPKTGKFVPGTECTFQTLMQMVNRIVQYLLYLSIPLVLGMIMYTAYLFLSAGGDPSKIAKAKKMLPPVAIGLFWILGSYLLVYTLLNTLLAPTIGNTAKGDVIFLNVLDKKP